MVKQTKSKSFSKNVWTFISGFAFVALSYGETVGVFTDNINEPIKFAASDVKAALESKGYTVEILSFASLNFSYAHKKL